MDPALQGRCVEPPVGNGVPSARQRRAVIVRSKATRQSAPLFGKADSHASACGRAGRVVRPYKLEMTGAKRRDTWIPPYRVGALNHP